MTRRRKLLIAAGVITAGVLAVPVGANAWIAGEASGHTYAVADVPPAPVALVFGAGLTPDKQPSPYLAYRLDIAKALFDAGKVQVILVSGDNRTHDYDEPTAMYDYLVAHGGPGEDIVRDYAGRDTYDSCSRARRIFGVDRLVLVSQGYHLPRAVATCQALGVDAVGVGDDSVQHLSFWPMGVMREYPADVNLVLDVARRRPPAVADPPSTAVADALRT